MKDRRLTLVISGYDNDATMSFGFRPEIVLRLGGYAVRPSRSNTCWMAVSAYPNDFTETRAYILSTTPGGLGTEDTATKLPQPLVRLASSNGV